MLSASHNPMPDNGIKFFARGGLKLDDDVEQAIEDAMTTAVVQPTGAGVGRVTDEPDAERATSTHLTPALHTRLDGLTVVLDCAQGAASLAAPDAFRALGAEVVAIHNTPSTAWTSTTAAARPISTRCARPWSRPAPTPASPSTATPTAAWRSTRPATRSTATTCWRSWRSYLHEDGALAGDTVVATVMSNLGFLNAMRSARRRRSSRRRSVTATCSRRCAAGGFNLGGEQSGHVIMSEHATTGDGILAALHVAARMATTGTLAGRARRA